VQPKKNADQQAYVIYYVVMALLSLNFDEADKIFALGLTGALGWVKSFSF
jgi:hypothetical protein